MACAAAPGVGIHGTNTRLIAFSIEIGRETFPKPTHHCSLCFQVCCSNKHDIAIMVNSCSGKMGKAVVQAAKSAGLHLLLVSFGCKDDAGKTIDVSGSEIEVHGPSQRDSVLSSLLHQYPNMIVVDYTVPDAVNANAQLYTKVGVPFVMGTTGGDRDLLYKTVEDANTYAVISPQMGKQVVAFLAAMEILAEQFPGAFAG